MADPVPEGPKPATGPHLSTVWAVAAFALPLTIVLASPMMSVDLAYVVRAGQIMLDTGGVLRTDPFLFTTRCGPWLNQQWGAELALGPVFDALGWLGLALVRAGLTAGIVAFAYAACRASGAARRAAAWLTLLASVLLLGGLQLRAQLFGLLFFAALLWILARRHEHPAGVFWAVPLLLLWANVHGSFPFGVLLLLVAWLEDRVTGRPDPRTLVAAGLGVVATAVTPFGASVWTYVVELSTNPVIREIVDEWRPPWITSAVGVVFYASVALAAVVLWRSRRSLPWPTLVELGVFLALAVASTRAIYWWGLLLPVTFARLPWASREGVDPRNRLNWALAGVFAAIPLFAVLRWLPYVDQEPPATLVSFAPRALTAELRSVLSPGEAFKNPQAWGSWFELTLPGHPLFVDSRFELMPVPSLDANHRIALAEPGWERALDALPVRVLVVDRDTEPRLVEALASNPTWTEVYEDQDGLVFVRKDRSAAGPAPPCDEDGG
jgi:hypothetical protein